MVNFDKISRLRGDSSLSVAQKSAPRFSGVSTSGEVVYFAWLLLSFDWMLASEGSKVCLSGCSCKHSPGFDFIPPSS